MSTTPNFVIPTSQLLLDSEFSQSVKWNERTLTDNNETQSLSWYNRVAYDVDGDESLNWSTKTLFDNNKTQSLVWKNRATYDIEGSQSINWNTRTLSGSWSIEHTGSSRTNLLSLGQFNDLSSSISNSPTFPLDTLNTNLSLLSAHGSSQKVLIAPNTALLIGTDAENQPFLQEPEFGNRFGYDIGANPTVTGNLHVTGTLSITGKLYSNLSSSVSDGTYVMGIGNITNGTITVQNGIIVAIQQAS